MPDNKPSSDATELIPPPPIPEKAKPWIAWVTWVVVISGPTAGLLIPILTTGKVMQVLVGVLGLMVSAAGALRGGLINPFKTAGGS